MREFELVLPCYNESKSLETLILRTQSAALEFGFSSQQFNLILVENGSSDDSIRVMESLKAGPLGEWFQVIRIDVNQGYGFGVFSGLKATQAPYVAWSHADQQCDPKDAFIALKKMQEQPDLKIIKGSRFGRDWKDRVVSVVFESLATILLGYRLTEVNAQPKVFPRALLKELDNPPLDFAFDLYVLYRGLKAGYQIEGIPVRFPPRVHGLSNWSFSFFSRWKHIKNMIKYIWRLSRDRD